MNSLEPFDSSARPTPTASQRNTILFGPEGLRAGWALLAFVVLFVLVSWLSNRAVHTFAPQMAPRATADEQPVSRVLLFESLFFGTVLLVSFLVSRLERRPLRAYGLGATAGAVRQFGTGLLVGLVLLSALVGALFAAHLLAFGHVLLSPAAAIEFGLLWFVAFLLVGLAEEYLLRGLLQFTLARGLAAIGSAMHLAPARARALGFWIAAAILSFFFAFGHRTNVGESPFGLVAVGLIGLVFCFSLWRTGSLWWAVGFHAAWDWAQSFVFGVPDSGNLMEHHLLSSTPMGPVLWSGGLTGPEGSLLILPTTVLVCGAILLTTRRAAVTPTRPLEHPQQSPL